MKIIGFVGLPGSGKGVASDVARRTGIKVLVMGDVIRSEADRLGLEPNDENLGAVGNMLRAREGPEAVAKRTLQMAKGDELIVIDGLRSNEEADFFRASAEEFHLVEVWTPPEIRLKRIERRGRPDDASAGESAKALEKRDSRELKWGMNEAISGADLRLNNEGDLDSFRREVKKLLSDLGAG